jgi:copper resistance protein B
MKAMFVDTRLLFVVMITAVSCFPAFAQSESEPRYYDRPDTEIAPSRFPADYRSPGKAPPKGKAIRKYAVDQPGPGPGNFGMMPVHDDPKFFSVRGDRFEYRTSQEFGEVFLWSIQVWYGGDYNKLYLESEGEWPNGTDSSESMYTELLYGRSYSAFWDVRAGVRQLDVESGPERTFAVAGLLGLAPQWIETQANLLVGEDDDYRMDAELEYNLLLTQRMVLQPRIETEVLFRDQPEYNLGQGISSLETGIRSRYEFSRKFAPYLGISWESSVGESRNIVQRGGDDPDSLFLVTGLKFWY